MIKPRITVYEGIRGSFYIYKAKQDEYSISGYHLGRIWKFIQREEQGNFGYNEKLAWEHEYREY